MACEICELLKDKERIIYEDEIVVAILVKKPAAKGHVRIIPKKHLAKIEDLESEEVLQLFTIANHTAAALFETIGAHGTNIISTEDEHFTLDVIARKPDDGLNFLWQPKQIPQNELESVHDAIKNKIIITKEGKKSEPIIEKKKRAFRKN